MPFRKVVFSLYKRLNYRFFVYMWGSVPRWSDTCDLVPHCCLFSSVSLQSTSGIFWIRGEEERMPVGGANGKKVGVVSFGNIPFKNQRRR